MAPGYRRDNREGDQPRRKTTTKRVIGGALMSSAPRLTLLRQAHARPLLELKTINITEDG
jgi:hypothetical protein